MQIKHLVEILVISSRKKEPSLRHRGYLVSQGPTRTPRALQTVMGETQGEGACS